MRKKNPLIGDNKVCMNLRDIDCKFLKKLGDGNKSKGLRYILDIAMEMKIKPPKEGKSWKK